MTSKRKIIADLRAELDKAQVEASNAAFRHRRDVAREEAVAVARRETIKFLEEGLEALLDLGHIPPRYRYDEPDGERDVDGRSVALTEAIEDAKALRLYRETRRGEAMQRGIDASRTVEFDVSWSNKDESDSILGEVA